MPPTPQGPSPQPLRLAALSGGFYSAADQSIPAQSALFFLGVTMSTSSLAREADEAPRSIFLVSYPKVIFLYPTMLAALIAGIYMAAAPVLREVPAPPAAVAAEGNPPVEVQPAKIEADHGRTDVHIVGAAFLLVVALNLIVFAFEFPRTTSLTLFFGITAVILAILLLFRFNEQILPALTTLLKGFQPMANATFYFSVFGVLLAIMLAVFVNVQFDYWEITPNELLHHHGFLSNLERFAAPSLKIDKEINDIFEYALLRSGRLVLHPSNEPRAFILENVLGINRKEEQLTKMLGALQVQVRNPTPIE